MKSASSIFKPFHHSHNNQNQDLNNNNNYVENSPQYYDLSSKSSSHFSNNNNKNNFTQNNNNQTYQNLRVNANSCSNMGRLNTNSNGVQFKIGYIGSAILTKGKTGLGCLQEPLRELYCIFRQSNSRLIQERRLVVSLDGIAMIYNELGIEKCLHNDLSFVYDVEYLQLVCEYRKDKKLYTAFVPAGRLYLFQIVLDL
jgi:hypothetical protein